MAREKGPSYWLARQTDEELVEYINDDDVDLSPEVHIDVGLSSELPAALFSRRSCVTAPSPELVGGMEDFPDSGPKISLGGNQLEMVPGDMIVRSR
jgi:hypothetical protein